MRWCKKNMMEVDTVGKAKAIIWMSSKNLNSEKSSVNEWFRWQMVAKKKWKNCQIFLNNIWIKENKELLKHSVQTILQQKMPSFITTLKQILTKFWGLKEHHSFLAWNPVF